MGCDCCWCWCSVCMHVFVLLLLLLLLLRACVILGAAVSACAAGRRWETVCAHAGSWRSIRAAQRCLCRGCPPRTVSGWAPSAPRTTSAPSASRSAAAACARASVNRACARARRYGVDAVAYVDEIAATVAALAPGAVHVTVRARGGGGSDATACSCVLRACGDGCVGGPEQRLWADGHARALRWSCRAPGGHYAAVSIAPQPATRSYSCVNAMRRRRYNALSECRVFKSDAEVRTLRDDAAQLRTPVLVGLLRSGGCL
jgi:hypothetical protein